jgi:hypothetical protein
MPPTRVTRWIPLLPVAAWSVLVGCSGSSGAATGLGSPDDDASTAPDAAQGETSDAAPDATSDTSADASSDGADHGGSDATADGTAGDAGTCPTCGSGSVCVEDQTSGGALILPDDAGACPSGRIPADAGTLLVCELAPTFHCAVLPSACTTALGSTAVAHCTCAPSLCSGEGMCSDVTPTLVECLLEVP